MNSFAVTLLILAFATAQILIGGTRLLYSIPAYVVLAIPALSAILPPWKTTSNARITCLFSAIAFSACILARNWFSPVDYLARPDFFIVCGSLTVYLIVALFLVRAPFRLAFFFALLVLGLAHAAIGVIQFKRGDQFMLLPWIHRTDTWWRASGFYISPNHFAGLMEVLALVSLSLVCWSSLRLVWKIAIGYAGAFCLLGLALSGSRGGYLSFAFGLCVFMVISLIAAKNALDKGILPRMVGALAALLILGGACYLLISQSETIKTRVLEINDPENMRFRLWKAAIEQFHQEPIWGTGSGTYLYYGRLFRNPLVQNDPIYVHNDYLHLLAEYGIVGAAFFVIFFAAHCIAGVKNISLLSRRVAAEGSAPANQLALQLGAFSAVAAYTFHSLVDFNLHIPANAFLMASMLGMIANPAASTARKPWAQKTAHIFSRLLLAVLGGAILFFGLPKLPGEWYAEKARAALRDYHLQEASSFAEKGLETEKHNPDLYYYAGEAMREMAAKKMGPPELSEKAIRMFKAGLVAFPQDIRMFLKLAQTYDETRRFEDAEEQLDQAVELDPNNSIVNAYYGFHYQREGFWEEAETQYRTALDLDPTNKMAQTGMEEVMKVLQPFRQAHPEIAPSKEDSDEDETDDSNDAGMPTPTPSK
jgi:O-antigen ligase